jgi:hypothetical protein
VTVVGPLGVAVGVLATGVPGVAVAGVTVAGVAVAGVAVPIVGVSVTGACSSRKRIEGLLHQWSLASAREPAVGVAVGVVVVFPPKPEQAVKRTLDRRMVPAIVINAHRLYAIKVNN